MNELNKKSLIQQETPTKNKYVEPQKCKTLAIIILVFVLVIAGVNAALYFGLKKKKSVLFWREVLRCRKDKGEIDVAMQMATLYNTKKGLILCGGGSDIHPSTSRPTLYRSMDDGETWMKVFIGNSDMFSLYEFQELPNGEFLGIVPDYLVRSKDKGLNWTVQEMPGTGFSMNQGNGVLLVSKNPGDIYRSIDNGKTFSIVHYCDQGCDNLRSISYAGNNVWYLGVGEEESNSSSHARVFKSIDAGMTWSKVFEKEIGSENYVIFSMYAYDENRVLIGTGGDGPEGSMIYMTTNGGKEWKLIINVAQTFDSSLQIVRSFYRGNDGRLFCCCDCSYASSSLWADEPDLNKNSMILVSNDMGETWEVFSRTNTKRLYWVSETKDGSFIAATGEYGQILKSYMK